MLFKSLLGLAALLGAFLTYVAFTPSHFRVEREALLRAEADAVFLHVGDVRAADAWNPFTKPDSGMKKEFSPETRGVGAFIIWNSRESAGRGTLTEVRPAELAVTRLDFEKPFGGTSYSAIRLEPRSGATLVRWSIEGETSFVPRALIALRIFTMDEMIGREFEKGLAELKRIVEAGPARP